MTQQQSDETLLQVQRMADLARQIPYRRLVELSEDHDLDRYRRDMAGKLAELSLIADYREKHAARQEVAHV